MTPRSGPGVPRSGPRDPKTQERPKSHPEVVSERPWWPPGAHLAPKRPPHFDRLGGGFWPSGAPFLKLCEAFRGASASAGRVGGTRDALTIKKMTST